MVFALLGHSGAHPPLRLPCGALVALLLVACSSPAPTAAPTAARSGHAGIQPAASASSQWAETIVASPGYRARQAEFLSICTQAAGPGGGGTYAQLCLLASGTGPLNENTIRDSLAKMNAREDTADFRANAILRMLALYGDSPLISPTLRGEMQDAVLNFKYWLDESGEDDLCWWSENHQGLFHTAELVAGTLYPDRIFPNSGMTGAQHVEHALPLIKNWLNRRGTFGFSEWHSNVYYNEDVPALVNLVDFAQDQEVATKAAMVLDLVGFDLAAHYYKGVFATAHGRTYSRTKIGGSNDSTSETAYIMLGLGGIDDLGNFSGTFLATSPRYWPPELLEQVASHAAPSIEHKQRDGIDVHEGPTYDIGYSDPDDIVFWWGMGAYATPATIDGTFAAVDYYDLWDDYFWDNLAFLEPYVDSRIYTPLSLFLRDITYGSVLGALSNYTWRTPDYQLSGAQDYLPGYFGQQIHVWQATLDPDAVVFTSAPGGLEDDYSASDWTGGWLPRATFHQNVGVLQYNRRPHPVGEAVVFVDVTHAYFPQWAFDGVEQVNGWTFGRRGDGYVALYSQQPAHWSESAPEYELVAQGKQNTWIVELGRRAEQGDYAAWRDRIAASSIGFEGGTVRYVSPSQGLVEVGASGPMRVNGLPADIGPYERFESPYSQQQFGSNETSINYDGWALKLNFELPLRTVVRE